MNKEWEIFLSIGRDMEKIAMWEAQKAEDQREARKEQVDGGKEGEKKIRSRKCEQQFVVKGNQVKPS